jgi:DNA-binding MarR family transcriptional regulator
VSDLAAGERVRPQSMASTVAALLAGGLVSRAPDPGDRRRVLIALTPAGREALAVDRRRREGWLADAIRGDLSPKEQRALADAAVLLARIAQSGDTRR